MPVPSVVSQIQDVTVYFRGALVRRSTELARGPDGWPKEVRLCGLPLCLDDGSLRVRFEPLNGGKSLPCATSIRVALEVPDPDASLAPAEDAELKAARQEECRIQDRIEQAQQARARLEAVNWAPRPVRKDQDPPPPEVNARLELLGFREAELLKLTGEEAALQKKLREASRRRADLEQKNALATSARQAKEDELRKSAIVALQPPASGDGEAKARMLIEYLVPGARWAPSYLLKFAPDMARAGLALRAMVCQRTGEDWNGVSLSLSTASPLAWTELPEWKSLRIGRRQPEPPKRGWRPPPVGAEELYQDYDRAIAALPVPQPPTGRAEAAPPGSGRRPEPPAKKPAPRPKKQARAMKDARPADDMFAGAAPPAEQAAVSEERTVERTVSAKTMAPPPPCAAPMAMPAPAPSMPAQAPPEAMRSRQAAGFRARDVLREAPEADESVALSDREGYADESAPSGEPTLPAGMDLGQAMRDYGRLAMPSASESGRGKLRLAAPGETYMEILIAHRIQVSFDVQTVIAMAVRLAEDAADAMPPDYVMQGSPGGFDYSYAAESPATIPSDGQCHNIPLATRDAGAKVRYVVVPREAPDVFRFGEVENPLDAPLLEGPVDVWTGNDFLLATRLYEVPRGGVLKLGLGVEQAIKAARNTTFEEEVSGMLGGTLNLKHAIRLELMNHLKRAADIEVRERIPVAVENDPDAKVSVKKSLPAWEEYKPDPGAPDAGLVGGHRWRVTLGAGEKKLLEAEYVIQIASKNELMGGNRREA